MEKNKKKYIFTMNNMNTNEIRLYCANVYKKHKNRVDKLKENRKNLRELNYNYLIDNMDYYDLTHLFPNTKKSKYTKNEIENILLMFETKNYNNEDDCSICYSFLHSDLQQEQDKIIKFPCTHEFHSSCLCTWIEKSFTCPLCRYNLFQDS